MKKQINFYHWVVFCTTGRRNAKLVVVGCSVVDTDEETKFIPNVHNYQS